MVETVYFKSEDKVFRKERDGIKPNTIRKEPFTITRNFEEEERFDKLKAFMDGRSKALNIIIENVGSGDTFERAVKDVTEWDGIYIISWTHPNTR